MNVSPQEIAKKLLTLSLGVRVTLSDGTTVKVLGGRTAESGLIDRSPYVEVADAPWAFEGIAAGYDRRRGIGRFAIVYWVRWAKNAEREKEILRGLFEGLFDAVKADPTLGNLVEDVRVVEATSGLDENAAYWWWATLLEVEIET